MDIEDLDEIQDNVSNDHYESIHTWEKEDIENVRQNLLQWYSINRRKLPWRGDIGPYVTTSQHVQQKNSIISKSIKRQGKEKALSTYFKPSNEEKKVKIEVKYETDIAVDTISSAMTDNVRRKISPYETWVSEIMCQQTRVDTVVEYFQRWIAKFPTIESLANGSEEEVNALWAGLGYYRRARLLHTGAKYVVENFNGELPNTVQELLKVPGIGPYTAGAIASLAFNQQEPLVDGNVLRVVARSRAIASDPKNKNLIQYSWKIAKSLVDGCDSPGELNQAIMELGATVCTIKNPQCSICPIRSNCLAYEISTTSTHIFSPKSQPIDSKDICSLCDASRRDEWQGLAQKEVTTYPLLARKSTAKDNILCVTVISCDKSLIENNQPESEVKIDYKNIKDENHKHSNWYFLMKQRPKDGLLAGQWEFCNEYLGSGTDIPSFSIRQKYGQQVLEHLTIASHKESISTQSKKKILTELLQDTERRDLGDLLHVFSHVKHHMGIEHIHFKSSMKNPKFSIFRNISTSTQLHLTKDQLESNNLSKKKLKNTIELCNWRWFTMHDMQEFGITTGVKKILSRVFNDSIQKQSHKRNSSSLSQANHPIKRSKSSKHNNVRINSSSIVKFLKK